jgi:hypothetical protein
VTACCLVYVERDKRNQVAVGHIDLAARDRVAQLRRVTLPCLGGVKSQAFLQFVIVC